ncbi:hypothetical protein ACFXPV_00520 [Streptomyces sp. NPDC059118]|uniref:hypothetical protein n=1 Tax=unclassified Streptomyces TaxID=2593676 RepID=UPI0036CCCDD0
MTEEDRAGLKEVLARCPELDKAAGHVRDFGEILTDRLGSTLPTWIDAVDATELELVMSGVGKADREVPRGREQGLLVDPTDRAATLSPPRPRSWPSQRFGQ